MAVTDGGGGGMATPVKGEGPRAVAVGSTGTPFRFRPAERTAIAVIAPSRVAAAAAGSDCTGRCRITSASFFCTRLCFLLALFLILYSLKLTASAFLLR